MDIGGHGINLDLRGGRGQSLEQSPPASAEDFPDMMRVCRFRRELENLKGVGHQSRDGRK